MLFVSRLRGLLIFTLLFSCLLTGQAIASIEINITLDQSTFTNGQGAPKISISATNGQSALTADVHLGYFSIQNGMIGTVYEFPDWNQSYQPWLPGITLPANFSLPSTYICTLPSNLSTGSWTAFVALTQPGTLNILKIAMAPFTIVANSVSGASYGAVSLSHRQSPSSLLPEVSANGSFFRSSGTLEDLISGIEGQQAELDHCIFVEMAMGSGIPSGLQTTMLDAGNALQLNSSVGPSISLPKTTETFGGQQFIFYGVPENQMPGNIYQGGSTYTFTGPGGSDVTPFTVSLTAPAPLNLTQPVLSTSAHQSAASNLELRWNGNNGQGEVTATLSGSDMTKSYSIDCLFKDDGSGTIPASLLTQLKNKLSTIPDIPGLPPGTVIPGLGATANLDVSRFNSAQFTTNDHSLGYGIATIDAGVSMPLTLD